MVLSERRRSSQSLLLSCRNESHISWAPPSMMMMLMMMRNCYCVDDGDGDMSKILDVMMMVASYVLTEEVK